MSDRGAVALALAVAAGAWVSRALPLWPALALAAAGLAARRPALLWVGALLLASALGARAWAGLDPPPPGLVRGTATVVTDPAPVGGAVRAVVRLDGRRYEAWARGRAGARLGERLAGQRVALAGRAGPVSPWRRATLARRHVAARLEVAEVGAWSPGPPVARLANGLRGLLRAGAEPLGEERRALLAGLVLGDDRGQAPETVADFRAAGLSHLLAVSGQNVAFVLALAAPVSAWLGLRGRLVAGLAVLALFGVLTRWEPSVLRAEAMAAIALAAATAGRPASPVRVLSLAVAGLLLVDPLLVGSLGFVLSCGACAGIVVLVPRLRRRLPLPLAVTVAAQVGVAPILVPVFGGVPVASLPANVLAAPAAGAVVVWGLAAGLPAGLLGGAAAQVLHLPTAALVGWIAGVARWSAGLPLGQLRAPHVAALAALAGLARHRAVARRPAAAAVVAGAMAAVVLAPALAGPPGADGAEVARGARLWRAGRASVLVVGDAAPGPLLDGLRARRVGRLSVLALTGPGAAAGAPLALAPVLARHRPALVLTAAGSAAGTRVAAGSLAVTVTATSPRLAVSVRRCPQACCPQACSGAGRYREQQAQGDRRATEGRSGREGGNGAPLRPEARLGAGVSRRPGTRRRRRLPRRPGPASRRPAGRRPGPPPAGCRRAGPGGGGP